MIYKQSTIFLYIILIANNLFAETNPSNPQNKDTTPPDIFGMLEETVKSDSTDRYLEILNTIAKDLGSDYANNQDLLSKAEDLLESDKFQESIDLLFSPGAFHLIIVPRYHLILATNYRHLKQDSEADLEKYIYLHLLSIIAKTGDGSKTKPYRVLHVETEYDLLKYQLKIERKDRLQQSHFQIDSRDYDVHTLKSGKKIWFDITERMKILRKYLKKKR